MKYIYVDHLRHNHITILDKNRYYIYHNQLINIPVNHKYNFNNPNVLKFITEDEYQNYLLKIL